MIYCTLNIFLHNDLPSGASQAFQDSVCMHKILLGSGYAVVFLLTTKPLFTFLVFSFFKYSACMCSMEECLVMSPAPIFMLDFSPWLVYSLSCSIYWSIHLFSVFSTHTCVQRSALCCHLSPFLCMTSLPGLSTSFLSFSIYWTIHLFFFSYHITLSWDDDLPSYPSPSLPPFFPLWCSENCQIL